MELSAGSWLVLAPLALLLLLLLAVPVRVGLHYGQSGFFDRVFVSVQVWVLSYRFALPAVRFLPGFEHPGENASRPQASPRLVSARRRAIQRATRRIERFEWRTRLSAGDAALTCWCTGLLWALKGALVGYLGRRHSFLTRPAIEVVPLDGGMGLGVELSCIFRFTVGEIILALLVGAFDAQRG